MALVINDRVRETSTTSGTGSKSVYLDSTGTPVGAASNGFAVAMAIAL
jgi:hypothetical protein